MNTRYLWIPLILAACHKGPGTPPHGFVGKWNLIAVHVAAYDSTGVETSSYTYTTPPGSYFEFDAQGRWVESLYPVADTSLGLSGTWSKVTDSTFVLTNPMASSSVVCSIDTLNSSTFAFSETRPALFNGTRHGYIGYTFELIQ
ncbi:hypothetical protein [Dinghuibacter silviterrae]|uniref:Lipocalin-like protein n=1 Tax=Dinghuibacter silviterrae TaxID=1539049 RepID=A0A4R8DRB4_9BACT|nr:hypothetical protein [Dinghuibacter silviterrae]TDX00366.1 hypothetical protein EDB95_1388 [Dinghuibacter silviterrae]